MGEGQFDKSFVGSNRARKLLKCARSTGGSKTNRRFEAGTESEDREVGRYVHEKSGSTQGRAAGREGRRSYLCGEAVALLTGPWMPSQALNGSSRFTERGYGGSGGQLLASPPLAYTAHASPGVALLRAATTVSLTLTASVCLAQG